MTKAGILKSELSGRQRYYWADPDCMIYGDLRNIVVKIFGVANTLEKALQPVSSEIAVAFLYGSIPAGTRLRPILMTSAATVVGHLTLVFATRPGAGARNSIGIMLVSGMIIGTSFTLFVVPAIYVLVAGIHRPVASTEREPEFAAAKAMATVPY